MSGTDGSGAPFAKDEEGFRRLLSQHYYPPPGARGPMSRERIQRLVTWARANVESTRLAWATPWALWAAFRDEYVAVGCHYVLGAEDTPLRLWVVTAKARTRDRAFRLFADVMHVLRANPDEIALGQRHGLVRRGYCAMSGILPGTRVPVGEP